MRQLNKTVILWISMVLFLPTVSGQSYTLEVSTDAYNYIDSSGYIGYFDGYYDNGSYFRNFGFTFKFFNKNRTGGLLETNGYIHFSSFDEDRIHAIGADLIRSSSSSSGIIFDTEQGSNGKIFKLQWRDAGLKLDEEEKDFLNFQIWLYENSNVIEIRFGKSSVSNLEYFDFDAPLIGISNEAGTSNFYLSGSPSNPKLVTGKPGTALLKSVPDSGMVYRFIPSDKSLVLMQPNGGEDWETGEMKNITWSTSNISKVDLAYSVDDGQSWKTIKDGINASGDSYAWSVPNDTTNTALVRLSESGALLADVSDATFRIIEPQPLLNLISPIGGESWPANDSRMITWESKLVDLILIEYSIDNGSAWKEIAPGETASGQTYSWQVPDEPSKQVRVKITDMNNPSRTSMSDNTFEIRAENTSIGGYSGSPEMYVYRGRLFLQPDKPGQGRVRIMNLSGATVYEGSLAGGTHRIDLQYLDAGIYLLQIQNGVDISIRKFIIP